MREHEHLKRKSSEMEKAGALASEKESFGSGEAGAEMQNAGSEGTGIRRYGLLINAIFYAVMLLLTFAARPIHEANLPHVTAEYPATALLPSEYIDENGEIRMGSATGIVISKDLLEGPVFVLYRDVKNGEERDFVREVQIVTGAELEETVEVISGITMRDRVVVSSTAELTDGAEVVIQ